MGDDRRRAATARAWPAKLLAGLTVRGRCLLSAGIAAFLPGLVLHEVNVTRVGVFLLALPVVSYVMVARTRYRLTCSRRLDPVRVGAGASARVLLRLQNVSRLPTGVMLAEDTVPYMLGGRPRFVLDRVLPQRTLEVDYSVRSQVRGRFRIGPLAVRLTDPFGLVELTRAFTASEPLVVTPQVVPLPEVRLGGEWSGAGQSTSRSVATAGEDDAATRDYRLGDDLRRIHWRSTARRGELMVRREEQPWQSRAVVLLDTRIDAHHGDGPLSSLEWAVSAAASVSLHLSHTGFMLRLVTDSGQELSPHATLADTFDSIVLDVLAEQQASLAASVSPGVTALRRGGGEELYVAIVGPMTGEDVDLLARCVHGASAVGIALVMDTASWTTLSPRAAEAAHQSFLASCDVLAASGWRVLPVRRGDNLADIWYDAGSGLEAAAGREAAAAGRKPSVAVPPQPAPLRTATR
jgi:uncharacterized protein (DUF58 family)